MKAKTIYLSRFSSLENRLATVKNYEITKKRIIEEPKNVARIKRIKYFAPLSVENALWLNTGINLNKKVHFSQTSRLKSIIFAQ